MSNYISGVSSYCNAWCNRCPFENRCQSAAMIQSSALKDIHEGVAPNVFNYVSGAFRDYWMRLDRILRTMGTTLEKEGYGMDQQDPKPVNLNKSAAKKIALQVTLAIADESDLPNTPWLNLPYNFDTPLGQAAASFAWHGLMIGAKVSRMIGSERKNLHSYGSRHNHDKTPTAKLNLIILTRSIAAATVIMEEQPRARKALLPVIRKMAMLLNFIRSTVPQAMKVRLPGFDAPEHEEFIERFYDGSMPIDPVADGSWVIGERAPAE